MPVDAIHTIGYGGYRSLEEFFQFLADRGIPFVVDVRANAESAHAGFTGRRMDLMAAAWCLSYAHFPSLGIPAEIRRAPAPLEALWDRYRREILPAAAADFDRLCSLVTHIPSVLVCAEKDPSRCHRSILAAALSERTGLKVVHL